MPQIYLDKGLEVDARLTEVLGALTNFQQNMITNQETVGNLITQYGDMVAGRTTALETGVSSLDSRASALEVTTTTLNSRATLLEGNVGTLAVRATNLEAGVENLEGNLSTLTTRTSSLETHSLPVGTVMQYAGATAPNGWHLCDGSAISRTTYSTLFTVIGTTYGSGNGTTTFNLPDTRGIFVKGAGTSATHTTANGTALSGTLGGYENDMMFSHAHVAVCLSGPAYPLYLQTTSTTSTPIYGVAHGYELNYGLYHDIANHIGAGHPMGDAPLSNYVGEPRLGNRNQPANISLNYIIYTGVFT